MKLSIAIATYNEEENIRRCLTSVSPISDEIILVDGSSNDKTAQIAKTLGAKVYIVKNQAMFHKNKQLAIEKCTGDWILQLDADEVVSEKLRDEITAVIGKISSDTTADVINGFWVPRKNYFLGRFLLKGGQYPDYTIRLYKKGKAKLPCKSVHEQAQVEGKTGYLKNDLQHYSYPNFTHYLEHFNLYTSIAADELFDEDKKRISFISYFFMKPVSWFLSTYIRHKGFEDGFPGFIFSFFSALRFLVIYIKYWEKTHSN